MYNLPLKLSLGAGNHSKRMKAIRSPYVGNDASIATITTLVVKLSGSGGLLVLVSQMLTQQLFSCDKNLLVGPLEDWHIM